MYLILAHMLKQTCICEIKTNNLTLRSEILTKVMKTPEDNLNTSKLPPFLEMEMFILNSISTEVRKLCKQYSILKNFSLVSASVKNSRNFNPYFDFRTYFKTLKRPCLPTFLIHVM